MMLSGAWNPYWHGEEGRDRAVMSFAEHIADAIKEADEILRLRAENGRLQETIKLQQRTVEAQRADREQLRAEVGRLRAHFTEIIVLQNRAISGEGLFMRAILIAKQALGEQRAV
jgi:hypothetical protein